MIDPDEHERLSQALQLTERPARRLMVPRPHMQALDIEGPLDTVVEQVVASRYTRMPVYRRTIDEIVGVLHTKDLLLHYAATGLVDDLRPLLRPALYVHESTTADKLIAAMQRNHSQLAIVLDEFGGVAGLVTLEDALSDVFGTTGSDGQDGEVQPQRLADGRVRLPGSMPLEEVEEWLGRAWEGDANTVAGHVTEALGHLPAEGEKVVVEGVHVEVEQVTNRVVTSVLAATSPSTSAPPSPAAPAAPVPENGSG